MTKMFELTDTEEAVVELMKQNNSLTFENQYLKKELKLIKKFLENDDEIHTETD